MSYRVQFRAICHPISDSVQKGRLRDSSEISHMAARRDFSGPLDVCYCNICAVYRSIFIN